MSIPIPDWDAYETTLLSADQRTSLIAAVKKVAGQGRFAVVGGKAIMVSAETLVADAVNKACRVINDMSTRHSSKPWHGVHCGVDHFYSIVHWTLYHSKSAGVFDERAVQADESHGVTMYKPDPAFGWLTMVADSTFPTVAASTQEPITLEQWRNRIYQYVGEWSCRLPARQKQHYQSVKELRDQVSQLLTATPNRTTVTHGDAQPVTAPKRARPREDLVIDPQEPVPTHQQPGPQSHQDPVPQLQQQPASQSHQQPQHRLFAPAVLGKKVVIPGLKIMPKLAIPPTGEKKKTTTA